MSTLYDTETPSPTLRQSCLDCNNPISSPALFRNRCDACQQAREKQWEQQRTSDLRDRRRQQWNDLLTYYNCESFRDNQHHYDVAITEEARACGNAWWNENHRQIQQGFGIFGPPGIGKTVVAVHLLRMLHLQGHSVAFTSDPRIATLARQRDREAEQEISKLKTADILLIDDLGQQATSSNPVARDLLFQIVHERHTAGRKLFWTAQGGASYLTAQLGYITQQQPVPGTDTTREAIIPVESVAAFLRRLHKPFCRAFNACR